MNNKRLEVELGENSKLFISGEQRELPILPLNVSRQDFLEVEQEVLKILKNAKKVTI